MQVIDFRCNRYHIDSIPQSLRHEKSTGGIQRINSIDFIISTTLDEEGLIPWYDGKAILT
jgi:hypothetical protein